MSQLPLKLPHAPVYAEDNFFISRSNEEAHRWIARWPDWSSHALILYGEPGCGKSHLGHMWAARAGAVIQPENLSALDRHALIEAIETLDARTLLHLLNIAKENRFSLLLTTNTAPNHLPFTLPDLTSRLLALPAVAIAPPDDDVLAAALRKQFADRQLKVEEEVIQYLAPRIERSFAKISALVDAIDHASLADHKNITVPLVKRVLGYS